MIEVYEYTKTEAESIQEKGIGFYVKDGKYYLPKDFVDAKEIKKGVLTQIEP